MAGPILPITIEAAELDPSFEGTPQELVQQIATLLRLVSQQDFALFTSGSTEPPYDTGPFAKDGNRWQYYSTSEGRYVDFDIPQTSLKFWMGTAAPGTAEESAHYLFGILVDSLTGLVINLQTYVNGTWTDSFYRKSELYTKTEVDNILTWAACGVQPNAAQSIPVDSTSVKLTNLGREFFDVAGSGGMFSTANSEITIPYTGYYDFSAMIHVQNDTATASGFRGFIRVAINGTPTTNGSGVAVASPPGSLWYFNLPSMILGLAAGDVITLHLFCLDGVGSGQVTVLADLGGFSCKLLRRITA